MKVSVVIPTYNRADLLRRTLRTVTTRTYPDVEVIVVDDGSTDATSQVVAEFPDVRYLRQANRGPAAARNAGIRLATGDAIAFTDDDCAVPADWLERLVDGYRRHPEVAGVGGYLAPPAEALRSSALARFELGEADPAGDREIVGGIDCPIGGTNNVSYTRTVLEAVGGFDERFPYPGGEDTDLKRRICDRGHRLLYLPVGVTHLRPYTWASFRRQQIVRGRGSVSFDRVRGRTPTRPRLIARAAKRGLRFLTDLPRRGPTQAAIRLWAGWLEVWGAWQEVSRPTSTPGPSRLSAER